MSADLRVILDAMQSIETEEEKDNYIEKLESFIIKCNKSEAGGIELVPDSVYDSVKELLRSVKPDSPVLSQIWSEDSDDEITDIDRYLMEHPMVSIQTIKDMESKDLSTFESLLPSDQITMIASLKLNGHGIRVIYKNGHLIKARSRGRSSNGRDITHQLIVILGEYNENLAKYGLVELRGEVLLPYANMDRARVYNPDIKSAFSGVSSMLRDSASDEEVKLLKFVGYDIFLDEEHFNTLSDKYNFIENMGFETPMAILFKTNSNTFRRMISPVLSQMQKYIDDGNGKTYEYYTDGVVVSVDNIDLFKQFGMADNHHYGNVALKMGFWEQNIYCATVKEIIWKRGKNKLSPVARIEDTLTGTGNTVRNVPLYNPYNLLLLEAYPERTVYFRYGGEAGVVPCFSDGRGITEI